MVNISTIRETYANMLDSQLIQVSLNDGISLTDEALKALKAEFIKRRLDLTYIENIEQRKTELLQHELEILKNKTAEDYSNLIWKYILEEKEKGTANEIILKGLSQKGLDEIQANQLLLSTNDKINDLIEKNDSALLRGGGIFILGLFITLVTYSQAKINGGVYFITWGAILWGAIDYFKGLFNKQKYKSLQKRINSEDN